MNTLVIVLIAIVVLVAAYTLYGRWIAKTDAEEFPDDTYSVEEITVSRFKLTGSEIYRSGNFKRFTFENEKDNWG